jgi:hypothetical protein
VEVIFCRECYGVEERKGGIGVEATATATVLHPRTKFERQWEVGSGKRRAGLVIGKCDARHTRTVGLRLMLNFPPFQLEFEEVPNKRERESSECFFSFRNRDVACVSASG